MKNVHYNVEGLINAQMKTQVKNVLQEVDGVSKVNVDLHRGSVEVDYSEETDENEIRKKIEQVGCRVD